MAAARKKLTTEEIVLLVCKDVSSNEDDSAAEESFSEYKGVDLSAFEDDGDSQEVSDEEKICESENHTCFYIQRGDDMAVHHPKSCPNFSKVPVDANECTDDDKECMDDINECMHTDDDNVMADLREVSIKGDLESDYNIYPFL